MRSSAGQGQQLSSSAWEERLHPKVKPVSPAGLMFSSCSRVPVDLNRLSFSSEITNNIASRHVF